MIFDDKELSKHDKKEDCYIAIGDSVSAQRIEPVRGLGSNMNNVN